MHYYSTLYTYTRMVDTERLITLGSAQTDREIWKSARPATQHRETAVKGEKTNTP